MRIAIFLFILLGCAGESIGAPKWWPFRSAKPNPLSRSFKDWDRSLRGHLWDDPAPVLARRKRLGITEREAYLWREVRINTSHNLASSVGLGTLPKGSELARAYASAGRGRGPRVVLQHPFTKRHFLYTLAKGDGKKERLVRQAFDASGKRIVLGDSEL